jgi:hypothetical protein
MTTYLLLVVIDWKKLTLPRFPSWIENKKGEPLLLDC